MKIKEIIENSMLGKIGLALVRGLQAARGGPGSNVGTAQQQKSFQQALLKKANQRANLDKVAAADFKQKMVAEGIKFHPWDEALREEARNFAIRFFAGGENDPDVMAYIIRNIQTETLPLNATEQKINEYFKEMNDIRTRALLFKDQGSLQGYYASQVK